jgi:heme/copper-type cytochrome/quinol oxidase subunit 3
VTATTSDTNVPTIDVRELPSYAFGHRSALFWAIVILIFIETTTLALMFMAYIYVQGNYLEWPPAQRIPVAPLALGTGTLVVSCIPMEVARRAARRFDLRATRLWLAMGLVLGVAACVFRYWSFDSLPFTWRDNSYASIVWLSFGTHATELVASVLETLVIIAVLFKGPLEKKHFEDAAVGCIFWYFAALVWVPFGLLFLFDGATP